MAIRCLLVEDEYFTRDVLSLTFRRSNMDVDVVSGGQDALNLLATKTYDVIVADLHMPNLNGYELISIIRNNPQLKKIIIVAITANPAAIRTPEAQMADAFFTKPLDIKQLIEKIKSLTSVSQL